MYCCTRCGDPDVEDVGLTTCIREKGECVDWAARVLIDRYRPMLEAAVWQLGHREDGGSLPYDDAQDAAQGARIGLIDAAKTFDPARGVPFKAFAKPHVQGAARRHLLSARGLTTRGLGLSLEPRAELPDDAAGLARSAEEDVLTRGWGYGAVAIAVAGLPDRHRVLVDAVYRNGYTVTELARQRGVTKQTVAVTHKRVLARLAEQYSSEWSPTAA